jgi:glycyl-tRNA synthetase beta chain
MPEFFLELFSEEIPARMQAAAALELERICNTVLRDLSVQVIRSYTGPRRIALAAKVATEKPGGVAEARGPRESAPEAALAGFLGKHKANRDEVIAEGGYYLLRRNEQPVTAAQLIIEALPAALTKFSWPKSMRWGQSGDFTWVRPLRRIICLLDGEVIPIRVGPVTASNITEGHRFLAPGAFAVSSVADWEEKLQVHKVVADEAKRQIRISEGLAQKCDKLNLTVAKQDIAFVDPLLDEVTGLVEWPIALIGKIDPQFMDLPPEVRELSMKVNQRYFALRDAEGKPAPYFAFVANIEAPDSCVAIIAGNERVLRARLSDARHFWDLDLKTPLDELLPKLDKITFHAKIGSQGERVKRISALAIKIADLLGAESYQSKQAGIAGLLCKADLVTGMVGEFPELQGIMGGYYAEKNPRGWDGTLVGPAIKTHYQPKGPNDEVPTGIVPGSVALADKIDTLTKFFEIGEKPTGSGDPYALRRAALGVIRIILENELAMPLRQLLNHNEDLLDFIIERLRVKLRGEGKRFDILDAVLGAGKDDDLVRIMRRVNAVTAFLGSPDGANLLVTYRRAANILKIEDAKDGPHSGIPNPNLFERAELEFDHALVVASSKFEYSLGVDDFEGALGFLSAIRSPIDVFFDKVTVNAPEPELRRNRLQLLAKLRDTMHQIADFSKIEG